jgi:SAM-dependent methyltransferase
MMQTAKGDSSPRGPFGLEILTNEQRFEMDVYQAFLNGAKGFWRDDVYARVKSEASSLANQSPTNIELKMRESDAYFLYSWLERRMQQFKYAGRWGLETMAEAHMHDIERLLPEDGDAKGAADSVPYYVKELDVHQHPGGLWTSPANAVAHEWYQSGASFSGVGTDVMVDYYSKTVLELMPRKDARVLDMGCTLGRMTLAIKKAAPAAYVEGIDVCEPALRLAKAKAKRDNLDVTFRLANCEEVPHPDASFDVVGSHWLFHELPKKAIKNTLDEMKRLTRKGGAVIVFDMQHVPGGSIGLWLHEGYAVRNNEPYAAGYAGIDMTKELKDRGFVDIKLLDFDPGTGATGWLEDLPSKRTHYSTVITARKP